MSCTVCGHEETGDLCIASGWGYELDHVADLCDTCAERIIPKVFEERRKEAERRAEAERRYNLPEAVAEREKIRDYILRQIDRKEEEQALKAVNKFLGIV